jgi:hypothetical protein
MCVSGSRQYKIKYGTYFLLENQILCMTQETTFQWLNVVFNSTSVYVQTQESRRNQNFKTALQTPTCETHIHITTRTRGNNTTSASSTRKYQEGGWRSGPQRWNDSTPQAKCNSVSTAICCFVSSLIMVLLTYSVSCNLQIHHSLKI